MGSLPKPKRWWLIALDKDTYLNKDAYNTDTRKIVIFHSPDFIILTSSILQQVRESDDVDDDDRTHDEW